MRFFKSSLRASLLVLRLGYSKQLLFECNICVLIGANLDNLFTETPNLFASETLDRDCFMDSPLTDAVKSAIVALASSDPLF
jgi:hypothetical protein